MNKFAENLKALREKAGLTPQDVADRLRCTRQAVESWEEGKTEPNMDETLILAKLFGVSVERLITGEDSAKEVATRKETRVEKTDPRGLKYWRERVKMSRNTLIFGCPLIAVLLIALIICSVKFDAVPTYLWIGYILGSALIILVVACNYKRSKDKYEECLRKENAQSDDAKAAKKQDMREYPVEQEVEKEVIKEVQPDDYAILRADMDTELLWSTIFCSIGWIVFLVMFILCLVKLPIKNFWFLDLFFLFILIFLPIAEVYAIRRYKNPNFLKRKKKNKDNDDKSE